MRAVFENDLRRFTGGRKFFVLRSLVVGVPLAIGMAVGQLGGRSGASDRVAVSAFWSIALAILILVYLLTPAMFASVLAEERHNHKLEVLRSTPLTTAQIVLGKWLSRLVAILTLTLAALSLPSILPLFGGIGIRDLLTVAGIIVLAAVNTSALSLWASASTADVGQATRRAYGAMVAMLLLPVLVVGYPTSFLVLRAGAPPTFATTMMNAVSGLHALGEVAARSSVRSLPTAVNEVLSQLVGTLVITTAALVSSIVAFARVGRPPRSVASSAETPTAPPQLGAAAIAAAAPGGKPTPITTGTFSRAPWLLRRAPLVWLETRRPGRPRRRALRVLGWGIVALLEVWYWLPILGAALRGGQNGFTFMREGSYVVPADIALTLAFLVVAGSGAVAFHRDRELHTVDILQATPLSNRAILRSKAIGALRPALPWWGLGVLHIALGVLTRCYSPLVLLGWIFVSAALILALLGFALITSLTADSSRRATLRTFIGVVALLVLFPVVVGLLLLLSRTATGFIPLACHPFWVAYLPFYLDPGRFGPTARGADELSVGVASLVVYCGYAFYALRVRLAAEYSVRRTDWQVELAVSE